MSTRLSLRGLATLASDVSVPGYARDDLTPGIVHFGVGNFHRAHQGVYLDDLFALGSSHDWAIVGAGVRPADERMRETLKAQDWLTTVVERDADTERARVTGAMIDYVAPGDTPTLLDWLANPAIRIVSLTITEGGYFIDASTGRFDAEHPEIVADAENIAEPKTVFGLLVAGLMARREAGTPPFTVMSCDNIPGNGRATRQAMTGLAALLDTDIARWIETEVAFPDSMVDRITPATTDRERALVAENWGIEDQAPVTCETFRQWVVEDHFPAGRPDLESAGVTFVDDVAPFETMKIRILNGGHAAIAYPAGLLDIEFAHEAMADPQISAFLGKLESEEIVPVVPPVPGQDLGVYVAKVAARFANPKVQDTVRRLCLDGSNRQPKFILPSVADRLAAGKDITGLALVSALWCRYCAGATESGVDIAPNDPDWDRLQRHARVARDEPSAFLEMRDIFGPLANNPTYVHAFSEALAAIWTQGTRDVLARYLAGQPIRN